MESGSSGGWRISSSTGSDRRTWALDYHRFVHPSGELPVTSTSIHPSHGESASIHGRFSAASASALVANVTGVDAVGLEERAAALGKRSIKRGSKLWALDLA